MGAFSGLGGYLSAASQPVANAAQRVGAYLGGTPQQMINDVDGPVTFAPDGKRIAFVRFPAAAGGAAAQSQLVITNVDGSGEHVLATRDGNTRFHRWSPAWSPDGKVIAIPITDSYANARQEGLETVDATTGRETPLGSHKWRSYSGLAWLPDGDHLAVTAADAGGLVNPQIWLVSYPDGVDERVRDRCRDHHPDEKCRRSLRRGCRDTQAD